MKTNFFTFLTSLRPIELKAIGELSEVIRLEPGDCVYERDDSSEALYIINKGMVEVIHEYDLLVDRVCLSYLERGEIFGEAEVLGDSPRTHSVRVCEPVSLQCFKKKDFSELIRRVPMFFHFMCQQLAAQLVKANELANVHGTCFELSGNLENFDIVTVYQTILSSSQTGELAITNELGETAAVFSFNRGVPQKAQFYHLLGEEAFWQLFLHEKLTGSFSFTQFKKESADSAIPGPTVSRDPTDILLTSMQYRDEFSSIREQLPDPSMALKRSQLNLNWADPELEELRPVAEAIWQYCYSSHHAVIKAFESLQFCELKFYKTLLHLLNTGHFELVPHNPSIEEADALETGALQVIRTMPVRSSRVVPTRSKTIPFNLPTRSTPAVLRAGA